jgi:acyl-CoA synthetase (AMP-forming)/AMP-acid ligase II
MTEDPRLREPSPAPPPRGQSSHPLLRLPSPDAIFAWRAGQPITVARFLNDVAALAERLPPSGHVINLSPDRYCFTVGFAAALTRGQVNLLPPHGAPELLRQLLTDYPDVYCLTDGASPATGLPEFAYPPALPVGRAAAPVPMIAANQPACVLFTSGSTGLPRPHARSWGELVASALAEGGRLDIARLARGTLLGTVPHQHSYGLESLVMLALQHGLALQAERLFYPADIRAHIAAARRPVMLVTTPVHLRVLLAEPETPPPVDLVLCATAPLATYLAREAETRFAGELYEIYGCSEAGQVAARRTAVTEEWRCLDGISLRQDASGTWASGVPIAVETILPDVIAPRDPTHFLLHGRIADMVNVAGKRTSLVHLNYHLNAIDGVTDGAFVMTEAADTASVGRLAAFVVAPRRDAGFILSELRARIDVAFLPRPLCLVPSLPRNTLGKLPHGEIQRLIADATRPGQQPDERHPPTEERHPRPDERHPRPDERHPRPDERHPRPDERHPPAAERHPRARPGDQSPHPSPESVPLPARHETTVTHHFPLDHPTAEGHFPGNPIIPGAVLLREILAAIVPNASAYEVRSAKFHLPVRPGDTVVMRWTTTAGDVRFTCALAGADRPAVTGALRLPS